MGSAKFWAFLKTKKEMWKPGVEYHLIKKGKNKGCYRVLLCNGKTMIATTIIAFQQTGN